MSSRKNGLSAQQRVLQAALPLFASKGDRTRIEDISSSSGVSVGSIYHHFGNRDGIVDALYAQKLSQLVDELSKATIEQRDLAGGVAAFIGTYVRWIRTHEDAALFIFGMRQFSPSTETLREAATRRSDSGAALLQWYAARVQEGSARRLDPMILELLLVGPAREYCQRFLAEATREDPEVVIPQLADAAVRALRQSEVPE